MKVDITAGTILDIPISSAHANIKALGGVEPQILIVEGMVTVIWNKA